MTPFVVSPHGATSPQNLRRYRWRKATYGQLIERPVLRGASGLVALTPVEADDLRRWLPEGPPITVIPNVADPALIRSGPWRPHGPGAAADLVSLARWDVRHKGLDRLADLATSMPAVSFTVHGDHCGNESELLDDLLADAPTNLHLAPSVHGVSKEARLRSASAFILLSRWEGLSMALLEAMALAVPCMVSPEVAETLGGDPPVVVVPNDRRAAEVVGASLADPTRLAEIGARGRRWVEANASADHVARATHDLYRRLAPVPLRSVPVGV